MSGWETVRIEHVDNYRPTGEVETFHGRMVLEIDEKKGWEGWEERYERDRALSDRAFRPTITLNYRVWTLYGVEGGWRVLVRYFRTSDDKLSGLSLFNDLTSRQVMDDFPNVAHEALNQGMWSRSDLGPPTANSAAAEWDEWRKLHPSPSGKPSDGLKEDDDGAGGDDELMDDDHDYASSGSDDSGGDDIMDDSDS